MTEEIEFLRFIMKILRSGGWLVALAVAILTGLIWRSSGIFAEQPEKFPVPAAGEMAIRKTLEQFVAAFNANDAKAMVQAMTPAVEYIDESSQRVAGSKGIFDFMESFFRGNSGAKLQITPEGARIVAPMVALEDAESVITIADKGKQTSRRISLVYAMDGDIWKIASIREYPEAVEATGQSNRLVELSWLEGTWVDESVDAMVETRFALAKDSSHITRDFVVRQQGEETLRGTQRIAVDPQTGAIKAWTFDSLGGHGESTWTRNGDSWLIRGRGVTGDGKEASATYIMKPLGKDRIEFQAVHKVVGDQVEPDSKTILVRKVANSKP